MGLLSRASQFSGNNSEQSENVFSKISHFYDVYKILSCIVFDTRNYRDYLKKIQTIISRIGTVIPLSTGNALILLRASVDRDLIAHRLSNSLKITILFSFETDCPENLVKSLGKV